MRSIAITLVLAGAAHGQYADSIRQAAKAPGRIKWVSAAQAQLSPKPDYWFVTQAEGCRWCVVQANMQTDAKLVRWSELFDCVATTKLADGDKMRPQDVFASPSKRKYMRFRGAPKSANDYCWRFAKAWQKFNQPKNR